MEMDGAGSSAKYGDSNGPQIQENDMAGGVVFSRETPLLNKGNEIHRKCGCSSKKLMSPASPMSGDSEVQKREKDKDLDRKLRKQDHIGGGLFQGAVIARDWELAESLILLEDRQTLNDALCIALDSIWFFTARRELYGIVGLIKKIVANGAHDFTQAIVRTSFLACVSACQSRTMSLANTVTIMAQRLHERLLEFDGEMISKAEADAKVQKFTEWTLKCIGFHSRCQGTWDRASQNAVVEVQPQLSAFKIFLGLAGNQLTVKDFTEAFDAACFPLTLFSSSFDPGWASGISATMVQGLLGMLVEGGAGNVNHCFLEASRFGSTELVHILLQISQRNGLKLDVNRALGFASKHCKIGTMECLVEEGDVIIFLDPLVRAAERGCMQVVQWFVNRGCGNLELYFALTAALSTRRVGIAAYLLPHVPQDVLDAMGVHILTSAGDPSGESLDGVAFLLQSNFLGDPTATYAVADSLANAGDEAVDPELKEFLQEHWSVASFYEGLQSGQEHYVNFMRILMFGQSPICLRDLPGSLRIAIAFLPLYRDCVDAGGELLSQRLRGQLVEAVRRLTNQPVNEGSHGKELLAILEHHLSPFIAQKSRSLTCWP